METISIDPAVVASATGARCPVTRSHDIVPLGDAAGYAVWRCPASATDFVWPVPSDADLKRYYDRTEWFEGGEHGGYANYDAQTDPSLPMIEGVLDTFPDDGNVRYVLDFGCGYGTHLKLAADRGWKCFGVELSDHARKTAIERHRDSMHIVEEVEELIPHEFDLVLMLDVIEHVSDPYALMFRLFNRGLIGPKTRIVISTPNARSSDAVRDGVEWIYRHPPSHLVYYSARSLARLMSTLQFEQVQVRGASPIPVTEGSRYVDEDLGPDESLAGYAGLICEAHGSRFYTFMLERYVPGTWSKLAEYEHVPRYQFARGFARGATVLDFGCGTGYGSRYLADEAADVLGLDIDAPALQWARFWHDSDRLRFERHADLGATLPSAAFDLVTCFEMIEHVDHAMQKETVASLARVVKPGGKLLISTPNPAVTVNYGANPYHLREMNEAEFLELLRPHFAHVTIYRQWVRPSILIGTQPIPSYAPLISERLSGERIVDEPPAFIAICSHEPIAPVDPLCSFDASFDMVLSETLVQKQMTGLRFENYRLTEERDEARRRENLAIGETSRQIEADRHKDDALATQAQVIAGMHEDFTAQQSSIDALRAEVGAKESALQAQATTIAGMHESFAAQQVSIDELRAEVVARDSALQAQATTIAGMHESFAAQQVNIDELRAEIVARDSALQGQAGTIAGMHESFAAQQVNIEELREQVVAKESALQVQAETIAAMQTAFEAQEAAIAGMHESFAVQQTNIDALRAEADARERTLREQAVTIADVSRTCSEQQARLEEQRVAQLDTAAAHALAIQHAEAHAAQLVQHGHNLEALLAQRTAEKEEWARHYAALENTRFVRLARLLHGNSGSRAPVVEVVYLIAGGLIPGSLKRRLAPIALKLRERFTKRTAANVVGFKPYQVKPPAHIRASRPRVLHVIANFMTGGSSRLVVDLLEHLGGDYEQRILTSFIPTPANYLGVDLTEISDRSQVDAMRAFIAGFDPQLVHVHYWGDCDEPWYRAVFDVVAERGCPIVQNINTPVAPYADVALARNVFVSRYVLDHFGDEQSHNTVIYPGSDFTLFAASRRPQRAQRCIGMVYRLERDKLDDAAIEPFIEAARAMPELKCLIVGGGSLLQPFKDRVHAEGLDDAFEFTGYVSYQSLPALYKRMDVFVAPIWKESFGQVSAFAMNMGIPVIGYDVGAIPEIVADPSLVAPARDAHALAAIAVGLVRDDRARASIGIANRERAARMFSVEAMIGSYRELYRELLRPVT